MGIYNYLCCENKGINVIFIFMKEKYPIDVVIPWVDGNDPNWQAEKNKYSGIKSTDNSSARYRDWNNLQYIFRGIEKFWPWVNNVFLITCGQKPTWLNTKCEKLRLVNHTDYMPDEFLPTFNSKTIELNLHRIEELSEHFIYLNDDFFPIRPLNAIDFFKEGLPCDCAEQTNLLSIYVPGDVDVQYTDFTNLGLLNAYFRKRIVTTHNLNRWYGPYLGLHGMLQAILKANQHFFTGFTMQHSAQSYLKSSFKKVWDAYPVILHTQCLNKFRQPIEANQWLVRYWQLAENNFYPYGMKKRKMFNKNFNEATTAIKEQRYDIICINDNPLISQKDFLLAKSQINQALDSLLPHKSVYEI